MYVYVQTSKTVMITIFTFARNSENLFDVQFETRSAGKKNDVVKQGKMSEFQVEEMRKLPCSDGACEEWQDRYSDAKFGNLVLDRLPTVAVLGGGEATDVFCSSLLSPKFCLCCTGGTNFSQT